MHVHIREATPDDNEELQKLQAECPQGRSLVVSTVNTPDFFARAKAYESYKVYVACEENRIIGSVAYGLREALVDGVPCRIAHEFQGFTSPDARKRGIAKKMLRIIDDELCDQKVALSYALIMEGNRPSMRMMESLGFERFRSLVMRVLPVYRELDAPDSKEIRQASAEDLPEIAALINDTWEDHQLFEPTTAETLARFINRTPAYGIENIFVSGDGNSILACLGFWDWSRITRVTVQTLSLKMQLTGLLLRISGLFRPMPQFIKPGDTMQQIMLSPIAFRDPRHLTMLLKHLNNIALGNNIKQIFCIGEPDHGLLQAMEGFIQVDTALHVYVRRRGKDVQLENKPVFINGIDL